MFIYQTLDAIDGKQARRTGNSNALGELFDHGCDSLSNREYIIQIVIWSTNRWKTPELIIVRNWYFFHLVVLSTAGACAMSLGFLNPFMMMGYCYLALVLFYLSHWQTYVTGIIWFSTSGTIIFSLAYNIIATPEIEENLFAGRMRFGQIDATEAQMTMMLIMVFTAIVGTGFWGTKVI